MKKRELRRKERIVYIITALLLYLSTVTTSYGITVLSVPPKTSISPVLPTVQISPVLPTRTITPVLPDDSLNKLISLDYNYTVANGKTTITKYKGTASNVTIPSQLGGYPVKVIGISAFFGNKTLASVVIPEGITILEDMSFSNCPNLVNVTLPSTLTALKGESFSLCPKLTDIKLPDSLTVLDSYAFHSSGLTTLTLSKNITDYMRLIDANNLTAINVVADNPAYTSINGVLYTKDKKNLVHFPVAKPGTSFNVPDGVTLIYSSAFNESKYLQQVTIPASTLIVDGMSYCESLTTVKFLGSGTMISSGCFSGDKALTNVTLPSNLKIIKEHTFEDCSSLKSINIPASVTTIEKGAFARCINLASINLPTDLKEIQSGTFNGCKALPSITIPNSVELINNYAFNGCSNLSTVTIPASVTKMGSSAFKNCTNLTDVRFEGNAPLIGPDLFANAASSFTIYYSSGKEGWTTPTWYGYPTKMYLTSADLPAIKVRLPITFPIPSTGSQLPPLPITRPVITLPETMTPSEDEAIILLPKDILPMPIFPIPTNQPDGVNPVTLGKVEMLFTLDKGTYNVNGEDKPMDVSPMVLQGRTVLPIFFAADPLGAKSEWDNEERKVTVTLGSTKLELWIGNNTALVNGVPKQIDPENAEVKPIIVNGRTMLPMRFVTENLGCSIEWLETTRQIKVNFDGNYLDPQPEPPMQ